MKTLHNHTLIYDAECPMCDLYTRGFVNAGMLDRKTGRIQYDANTTNLYPQLDRERACNEIALVNSANGEVTYGVDSLAFVIGNSFPFINKMMKYSWIQIMMSKLYSFISYNRKVIVPGEKFETGGACVPTYNRTYRRFYIVIAWFFTAMILTYYSRFFFPFIARSTFAREYIICGGQIIFQGAILFFLRRDRMIYYFGNMMTISLAGALMLLPFMVVKAMIPALPSYAAFIWFFAVVGLMLLEHIRRLKILEIHWAASCTWVIYRILVLIILLTFIQ